MFAQPPSLVQIPLIPILKVTALAELGFIEKRIPMLAKPSVQSITLEPGFFAAIHTDTSSAGPAVGRNVND